MRRFLRENGLSLAMFALFFLAFIGQTITEFKEFNQDQQEHHRGQIGFGAYVRTGHFVEATFENWESEFLQMGAYVALTIFLRQKGSPESKKLQGEEDCDKEPEPHENAPGPVRRGGWALRVYKSSLSLCLFALFALSFMLHAAGGAREHNRQQALHGSSDPPLSTAQFISTSEFWFQSFQNWQSEFLSVGALIVLSVFLRQQGSPQSKAVDAPHWETGEG